MRHLPGLLTGPLVAAALAACAAGPAGESEPTGAVAQAIVGGETSPPEDDFAVLIGRVGQPLNGCGGALIAPRLVVTARHCVTRSVSSDSNFDCQPNGEPKKGGGGFVEEVYSPDRIRVLAGVDAFGRWKNDGDMGSEVEKILDDGSRSYCSHDIAFLVLKDPITLPSAVPLRLRLTARPTTKDSVSVAGWGAAENNRRYSLRLRRPGLPVLRVGPPDAAGFTDGVTMPRMFATPSAACTGDSGAPSYVPSTRTLLGVVLMGEGLDPTYPSSPCLTPTAQVYSLNPLDFGALIHQAFAAAAAEPLVEGREKAGWFAFGESCQLDVACEGSVCLKAADGSGTCNRDCTAAGVACPAELTCDAATSRCVALPGAKPATTAPPPPPPPGADAAGPGVDGCSMHDSPAPVSASAGLWLLGLIALVARRRRAS